MWKTAILALILLSVVIAFVFVKSMKAPSDPLETHPSLTNEVQIPKASKTQIITQGLEVPWAIVFLPDNSILVTERSGKVRLIRDGKLQAEPVAISGVKEIGEGGLLGITIHPKFSTNHFVYLYYTYGGSGGSTLNKVVRMTYQDNQLKDEVTLVDKIPGASNHNGGRIKFGPDGYLYITTGDAQNPSQAQDPATLAGKILRMTDEGKAAPGNPFNSLVYSYGHRNPQGLAWDATGQLWETEHGPSGGNLGTGNDEVNKMIMGKNYGWPIIQGNQTKSGMEVPIKNSTPTTTWAPAGAAFYKGKIFFGGLRGQALFELNLQGLELKEHFKNEFGRIRDVVLGPDNMLYITTSNRDGRGYPNPSDDKIIRINPEKL